MKLLNVQQIIIMHELLIAETGGISGLRDEGLLESAVNAPFQTFDGMYVHKTIESKAARLCYGLIKNHPFADGNKRIGMLSLMVFLELNEVKLTCSDNEIINTGIKLAAGEMDVTELTEWIIQHI